MQLKQSGHLSQAKDTHFSSFKLFYNYDRPDTYSLLKFRKR